MSASAPIGSVITADVVLDNFGLPETDALLYEGLDTPAPFAERASGALRVPLPDEPGPIAPALVVELRETAPQPVEMLVYLSAQADLRAAASILDWNARGVAVVSALQVEAQATQARLVAALRARGYVARQYWIVNAIAVTGGEELATWLAYQPGVALITPNTLHTLDVSPPVDAPAGQGQPAWGLSRIGAPSVWDDWGVRGTGIVVANIDTGVEYTHSALLTRYRGWSPAGTSHDYHWFDAAGRPTQTFPVDRAGHGTHTMGTLVGGAAGEYSSLGVAPDARWIAARACQGIICADEDLIAAAQWLLAPTNLEGTSPRPDLRPHIISNSWGKQGADPWYQGYVVAWNAAGIFSAFAAGNSGTFEGCASSSAPANYPESFAVGATEATDVIADFSSRGPTADGRLKPEVSAPGVAVPSAWLSGTVKLQNGTSMATPHVAGLVALLWSANPTLIGNLAETHAILTQTALPRPTSECGSGGALVPNNVYGWGRVDARRAVEAARVDVAWLAIPPAVTLPANGSKRVEVLLDARQVSAPGTYSARILVARGGSLEPVPVEFHVLPSADTAQLTGSLTDYWYGNGIYGRLLIGSGPQVTTDSAGHFTATLPFGEYGLTATAHGYFSASATVALTGPVTTDLVLVPDLPHVQAAAPPIEAQLGFGERIQAAITVTNAGTRPLSVTASVVPLEWITEIAGQPAAALYDLSATPALSLSDDLVYPEPLELGFSIPIFGIVTNHLYLSSNGWVSATPADSAAPLASCLPSPGVPAGTLAPFWADLDPGAGGAVRAGQVDGDTFVVSFEAVPPWQEDPAPDGPSYSFQLVLRSTGQIEFLYGAMGPLPDRWSVGLGYDEVRGQRLACYQSLDELSNRMWRFRNQPLPSFWLGVEPGQVALDPGATGAFTALLSGFGYAAWHPDPFSGIIRLTTNDPGQSTIDIPVTATIGAPAHSIWYPLVGY